MWCYDVVTKLRPHGSNKNPEAGDHVGGDETQTLRRRGERQCVAGQGSGGGGG